jgi:hypothetical protein
MGSEPQAYRIAFVACPPAGCPHNPTGAVLSRNPGPPRRSLERPSCAHSTSLALSNMPFTGRFDRCGRMPSELYCGALHVTGNPSWCSPDLLLEDTRCRPCSSSSLPLPFSPCWLAAPATSPLPLPLRLLTLPLRLLTPPLRLLTLPLRLLTLPLRLLKKLLLPLRKKKLLLLSEFSIVIA